MEEHTFATNTQLTPDHHDPRGSLWRRWDLHVHTPKSFEHQYPGGDTPEGWTSYLEDLRQLPPTIKVLGINDYFTVDGYEVVAKEHQRGNLPNIDLVLPVIELRLDTFGGTDTTWNKVNFHVIFSNHVDIDDIRAHFLSSLEAKHTVWQGKLIDRRTFAEFGKRIIESIPPNKRHGNYTPEEVAYRSLTFDLRDLQNYLTATVFKDNHLTAVGKAEWANMRWDTAIPDKRTIIDSASIIFTAAESPEACRNAQRKLIEEGVTAPLLDCSDAHHVSTSKEKDRLGHCYTWIKADTTFAGLQQALHNTQRIYIGDRPDKLRTVDQNPTKFISEIRISKAADADIDEEWFDNTVPLNNDFVAIIGNKGMGKSALTDIIALTSNTDLSPKHFAFLDEKHFRDNDNKARHFIATTTWLAGAQRTRRLDENVPAGTLSLVRYIPQHYFEGLCNETANTGKLQEELQKVIFSHLDQSETLGHATLKALIDDRTATADEQIATLRTQLQSTNRELLELERATTTNSIAKLEDALHLKEASLAAHLASEPTTVPPPTTPSSTPALETANEERRRLENDLANIRDALKTARAQHAAATDLNARLTQFAQSVERLKSETATSFDTLGLAFVDIVTVTIARETITQRRDTLAQVIATHQQQLDTTEAALRQTNDRVAVITDQLDEPNRLYQRYQRDHEVWERTREQLIGTSTHPNSINGLKAELAHHRETLPQRIKKLRTQRATISTAIHEQLLGKAAFQRQLYARIQDELKNSPILTTKLPITFDARLVDQGLANTFNNYINHSRTGKFVEEETVTDLLRQTDINNKESLAATLDRIISDLFDGDDVENVERQLRKAGGISIERVYQYLYGLEYLDPRYSLRIKGRELSQLTPGERGSVLLVFYLLADKDTRPLIIDQPEENLDNQSLYELVAPCIAEAKKRRQIIMVTHNPNLAVVCDAEQIIWCSIDKDGKNKVTYDAGSIENPRMNTHVVNVLEGTWPAFRTRERMYQD